MRARLVPLLLLLVLPATAVAQAKSKGRFVDPYWGLEYRLEGLTPLLNLGAPLRIYKGRTKDLHVEILVFESATPRTPEDWCKAAAETVRKQPRVTDVKVAGRNFTFRRRSLAGLDGFHGRTFLVRGLQCFEVRVRADAPGRGDAIAKALAGGKLKDKAPGTALAFRVGRERGRDPDHPLVLLEAGIEYATGKVFHQINLPMAQRVFVRAREKLKPNTLKPDQVWMLNEYGGLAFRDKPREAIAWHTRAEAVARKAATFERARQSAYNIACAASRAGDLDTAFGALYRAYDGGRPVEDSHVSGDKDLENCRKDERWHTFWRDKVKGR